jgi:hypothetical protein
VFTKSAIDNVSNIHNSALEASHNSVLPNWALPHRLEGDLLPSVMYDHFGIIDVLPTGEMILGFRRGTSHETDAGDLYYAKMDLNGNWGSPTQIAGDSDLDYRGAAGGVMPNGRIAYATATKSIGSGLYVDIVIYTSDDYGDTWGLKYQAANLPAPAGQLPYGRGQILDNKYSIPIYGTDGAGVYRVYFLQTADGGDTWTSTVSTPMTATFASLYNETEIMPLGNDHVVAITRVGSGAGGVFIQFHSTDGGVTWSEIGSVPATSGHGASVVVSPSLNYVTNKSGRPFVILLYTDRTTDECVYRYCDVDSIIADDLTAWSYDRRVLYSAPNLSGYQNAVVLNNNRLIGNLFRETTSDAVAGAYMWEADVPDLPDYDSGWTTVALSTTYALSHGIQHEPTHVLVEFADVAGGTRYINNAYTIESTGTKGVGALVSTGSNLIVVRTGDFALYVGTVFGSPTVSNLTSGVMRVRAWA